MAFSPSRETYFTVNLICMTFPLCPLKSFGGRQEPMTLSLPKSRLVLELGLVAFSASYGRQQRMPLISDGEAKRFQQSISHPSSQQPGRHLVKHAVHVPDATRQGQPEGKQLLRPVRQFFASSSTLSGVGLDSRWAARRMRSSSPQGRAETAAMSASVNSGLPFSSRQAAMAQRA